MTAAEFEFWLDAIALAVAALGTVVFLVARRLGRRRDLPPPHLP